MIGGHSYYHGHQDRFRDHKVEHLGMRDRFDNRRVNDRRPSMNNDRRPSMNNDRRRSQIGNRENGVRNTVVRNDGQSTSRRIAERSSSTRVTVNRENRSSSPSRSFRQGSSSPSRSFSQGSMRGSQKSSISAGGIRSSRGTQRK